MASKSHQFILDILQMKVAQDGFMTVAYEGNSENNLLKYKIPPKLITHRPDIIAIGYNDTIAIGEAKTKSDFSERTKQQILDYYTICSKLNTGSKIYLGIPESCKFQYNNFLQQNYIDLDYINIISLPDSLVDEYNEKQGN